MKNEFFMTLITQKLWIHLTESSQPISKGDYLWNKSYAVCMVGSLR